MINRIYRLMDTKRIEMVQREASFMQDSVIIKPEYMAICAADRRYYYGKRKKEILNKKLPMALIHEAIGAVLHDFTGHLERGTKVVMVPLEPDESFSAVKGNYRPKSRFLSSGIDGFMQDIIVLSSDSIVPIHEENSIIYVFSELVSVVLNALEAFESSCITERLAFGVWGDGSMGYVVSLVLRCLYPDAQVYVFGKTPRKLQRFSFADETFYIDRVPADIKVDHCFECVGGKGSETAISQMVELVSPRGCINLLGVSEEPVTVNTRAVLDKGLILIGNSRSDAGDIIKAVSLIRDNDLCRRYLRILISEIIDVQSEGDIAHAFEQDLLNDFKTVIRWGL